MWVDTADLPTNAGHPFFERLNRVLEEAGFDAFVEELCAAFYAARMGRPSLRPGRYFRLLLIGYFEGLSSERGIAWRVADSLSLRSFLDLDVTEAAPDHSTLSRTRRLIDVETHVSVFTWVLERLVDAGLVRGGLPQNLWVERRAGSPRQTHSVPVCSPPSRRVAPLRPRCAGLTAWTPAARTSVPALV